MTTGQKKTILLALRKAAEILEEELGEGSPVLPKRRRNNMRAHFEGRYELGVRTKPVASKIKKSVV